MWFPNFSGRAVTSIFRCNSKLYEFPASALKFLLTLITTGLVIGFYPQLCVGVKNFYGERRMEVTVLPFLAITLYMRST